MAVFHARFSEKTLNVFMNHCRGVSSSNILITNSTFEFGLSKAVWLQRSNQSEKTKFQIKLVDLVADPNSLGNNKGWKDKLQNQRMKVTCYI